MADENSPFSDLEIQWSEQQIEFKKQLITTDQLELKRNGAGRYIGGCDISFFKDNTVDAVASLVVIELPTLQVVYEDYQIVQLTQPYIPGFLAFREVDHLVALMDQLRTNHPELVPEVLLVDGNGILHPRGFGLASHLGVLAKIPTIGVAKNLFVLDGITSSRDQSRRAKQQQQQQQQAQDKNVNDSTLLDYTLLVGDSGQVWGAALVLPNQVKSIYVSIGHCVSLETAIRVVRSCQTVRIPEPIRQADLRSRAYVRRMLQEQEQQRRRQQQQPEQQVVSVTTTTTTTTAAAAATTATTTVAAADPKRPTEQQL